MALIGPDGEQRSHLGGREVADPAPGSGPFRLPPRGPDKGRWVGPPRGQGPEWPRKESPMPTPHEEAVLKAIEKQQDPDALPAGATGTDINYQRRKAAAALRDLLEHANLSNDSRRILMQALGVVAMLP